MKKVRKYRFFHLIIMIYLTAAFSWWAILLLQKNEESRDLSLKLSEYDQSLTIKEINSEYDKQTKMIWGEGLVFALSIIAGLFLINRAFWKELELNKNINNFLLSITHELKTPIATINLINKTLINKDLPEGKRKELLLTAKEESSRLESLVNNILTAAQMEQEYVYNMEMENLTQLIQKRVDRYQRLFQDRAFRYNHDSDIMMKLDTEAFTKLIDNILDNAVKYSPDGFPVTVELSKNINTVDISIVDEGSGIQDSEKKRVYEKFYRIGNENTRESKGTGLGLFIVNEICKAHNGRMTILDNNPQGTIIQIRLNIN